MSSGDKNIANNSDWVIESSIAQSQLHSLISKTTKHFSQKP